MKTNYQKKIGVVCLFITTFLAFSFVPFLYGPGLKNAVPIGAYLNGVFPSSTPAGTVDINASYSVTNAFPNLTFVDPVDMEELPGGNEFLVLGLQGHIWKISNNAQTSSKQLLLDISDNVVNYADGGMLGIVLHPEYGQTDSPNAEYIYVFYRYTPIQGTDRVNPAVDGYMRLSRFTLPIGANAINPSSEEVLINIFDRHDWHNGGDMFFGPEDKFLYLAVGDEGAAYDSYNVTQQIDKYLFGGVLRIDVDKRGGEVSHPIKKQPLNAGVPPAGWPDSFTQGYYIPNDNPWVDSSGDNLEEFYAIGTRSPHRMSLDPVTGDIWVGDIGQGSKEEVSIVRKGDNLQWPYREGDQDGKAEMPSPLIGNDSPPLYSYGRSVGRAVIGGMVYRGERYPELKGKYVFGDHETQEVWTLTKTGQNTGSASYLMNVPIDGEGSKDGISSFFTDSDGYMYILDLFGTAQDGGVIHKVVRSGTVSDPPIKLSSLNVFSDLESLTPVAGIVPYDVNTPLWSDGAEKQRWIALPNDGEHNSAAEQIVFQNEENWSFPPGTVVIKQFNLPIDENDSTKIIKLETRFLVFNENNNAYAVTYKWNDEQTDAVLVGLDESISQKYQVKKKDGSVVEQTWDFPTRNQCMQCHNSVAGYSLGLKTRQLNKNFTYPSTGITGNQLETWSHLNMFTNDIPSHVKLPASAHINSEKASDVMKVRSYMDANCAYCHRPNGVEGAFDGRAMTALYDQYLINQDVESHASIPGNKIVKPKDVINSTLYVRDASNSDDRMPPIGRNMLDEDYLEILTGWIDGLDVNGPISVENGWYNLKMGNLEKYLAIEDASLLTNARAINSISNVGDDRKWYVEEMGGGKYRIKALHSDMVLSLRTLKAERGSNVVQEMWDGSQHQLWYFEDIDGENLRIVSAYNGLALHISKGTTENDRPGVTWTSSNSANQKWKLEPVSKETEVSAIGETGKVEANHNWATVKLNRNYKNPVVIAGAPTYEGSNQATVRVKDVTSSSFRVRIDEWECWDESHLFETIPYIVVEAGVHELVNGKLLQAGNIEGRDHQWYRQRFNRSFNEEPLVFGQCVTENEAEAVNVFFDERYSNTNQLRLKLKERDNAIGGHKPEIVSWLAVEPGTLTEGDSSFEMINSGRTVNHNWHTLNFSQNYDDNALFIGGLGSEYGGNAASLRYKELKGTDVRVFVEEEICGDVEIAHTNEEVHYMVFGSEVDVMGKTYEESSNTVALKSNELLSDFFFEKVFSENESHVVNIKWTVNNDIGIETFSIEKSVNGDNFRFVTDQPGVRSIGHNNYNGYDYSPIIGSAVYRIAAITVEGKTVYSDEIKVDFKNPGNNVMLFPNPIDRSKTLTADILLVDGEENEEDLTLSIFTIEGRFIRSWTKLMDCQQSFEQLATDDLGTGVYILKVQGKKWSQTRKFIVR
ncbi:PQQ-dependent sugar dehydrogenase [Zobellia uliginosa]|uniref:PQQ-dependent sugar dehydrogenase n=1 Tax=Zobellia uliginosa TaxID=143224 RepID=UPI001C06D988|nr:PQQ-dependent sugar dehydrogenase [Zobellia uliginosa]MBU2946731.1 PQQ-dependent sugar dehydrogenase [Zobellia uliginosa]